MPSVTRTSTGNHDHDDDVTIMIRVTVMKAPSYGDFFIILLPNA